MIRLFSALANVSLFGFLVEISKQIAWILPTNNRTNESIRL